jgi:hypothetical protein
MQDHHIIHLLLRFVVFVSVIILIVYIFKRWLKHREREWAFVMRQDNNKSLAPLRITAYERIVVMLERITPHSMVMRHNMNSTSAALLQMELIRALREEFDHNVSLQMYVSVDCWEKVKRAKEETAELIKIAFTRVRPEATAMEFSREILKLEAAVSNSAIREAILAVRMDMAKYY